MLAPDSTAAVTRGHHAAGASLGDNVKVMFYSLRRQLAYDVGSYSVTVYSPLYIAAESVPPEILMASPMLTASRL